MKQNKHILEIDPDKLNDRKTVNHLKQIENVSVSRTSSSSKKKSD